MRLPSSFRRSLETVFCVFALFASVLGVNGAEIDLLWISLDQENAQTAAVSWMTPEDGTSTLYFGKDASCPERGTSVSEAQALPDIPGHPYLQRAQIPLMEAVGPDSRCFYRVETITKDGKKFVSDTHSFKTLSTSELRLAFLGNLHCRAISASVRELDPHVILLTGDLIPCLWEKDIPPEEAKENLLPFCRLVKNNQELFASVILMPTLGNHDREITPRVERFPGPSVSYDTEGTAFCRFFALPGKRWCWYVDWEPLSLRIAALDLNHFQDHGTSLQSCHAWGKDSEQFQWFDQVSRNDRDFFVVFQNEKCSAIRAAENYAWHEMFKRGQLLIAGFGHYAERAEFDGVSYFNTSVYGRGDRYPDGKKVFFESIDNFILLTVTKGKMRSEIRAAETGEVLDSKEWEK